MKRTVIKIDENLCNGCGNCVSGCHEGALQLIDNKAVMISDLYCDGLGACIGECPVGAISFEEREAEPYNEIAVMERLVPKGETVVLAHLKHLKDHNEMEWVREAVEYLKSNNVKNITISKIGLDTNGNMSNDDANQTSAKSAAPETLPKPDSQPSVCGCPGSMAREIKRPANEGMATAGFAQTPHFGTPINMPQSSELRQFPVQLHLVNPQAGFFQGADLLLAADCTAFASGEFHNRFLKGKSLAIACPKLDSNTQIYTDKLTQMIDNAKINTLTVLVMEVPCCGGLVRIAQLARNQAERNIPLKVIVLSVSGEIIDDKWL